MRDKKDFNIYSGDYDLDNFDVDDEQTEKADNPADYGDDFDSQTGIRNQSDCEDGYHDGFGTDNTTDIYSSSGSANSREKTKSKSKKKKHNNRTVAIVLSIAAVICLIAAIVFALSQCSDNADNKATTAPAETTAQPSTVQTIEETEPYVEAEHTIVQPDTEANVITTSPEPAATEAPTQAEPVQTETAATEIVTEPLTEPLTEPVTEAPAQTVAPADEEEENIVVEENFE